MFRPLPFVKIASMLGLGVIQFKKRIVRVYDAAGTENREHLIVRCFAYDAEAVRKVMDAEPHAGRMLDEIISKRRTAHAPDFAA